MCSINKYLTEKMIDYHIIEPEDIEIYTYGLNKWLYNNCKYIYLPYLFCLFQLKNSILP